MSSKKILFLHGYAQSASIFSAKTGGLRKALKKQGYDSHYVNGSLALKGDMLHDSTDEDLDLYGWWVYGMKDYDIQPALDQVLEEAKKHGDEVEGIIGFSQGGGLSGAIAAQYKKYIPSLKWAVFFSGFRLMPQRFDSWYEPKIELPTLHVLGELDTVVEESRVLKLYDASQDEKRTLLKHQGGHYVPNNKDFVNKIVAWIIDATKEKEPESTKKDDDDGIDDDLLAAIDNIGKK
ncbi:hypothetical protein BN7_659 [Wickerhamomyces ciferrii]|uniref:Serine hydrolase domain-containing protein n=1 Tax=Wickerhamomyces ciferrii (strain ATCC 14091 / BCRC 22168 / CBS 111 / JCM 3599 / NBRC 0793 / NRRL Y-1031 F-60-10) TaxID=1206466 RepID=K0KFX8_WICCF|nr:uncharacterized protein BN7_659 [Wickerhamomyces ciferrii]CCH41122.1 hypothetical protein BN7_659 [Wickerhamomyces ciferrii]